MDNGSGVDGCVFSEGGGIAILRLDKGDEFLPGRAIA